MLPPARWCASDNFTDTVIIDRIHYVPFAVEPEAVTLINGNGQGPPALTEREWDIVKDLYRDPQQRRPRAPRLMPRVRRGNFPPHWTNTTQLPKAAKPGQLLQRAGLFCGY